MVRSGQKPALFEKMPKCIHPGVELGIPIPGAESVPTFRALLRDVLDHPDDAVPRQILGDYLLDQPDAGDQARGEFIHVQCRLAAMADDDPDRPELERREIELLPEYPQRWARPFRRRGAKAWTFGRGLVEGLTLGGIEFGRVAEKIVR